MTDNPVPDRISRQLSRWGGLGLGAVSLCWLGLLLRGAWSAPGAPMEEGKVLIGARLVSDGGWPNEAFEHLYGPGDVWLVGGLFRIFGESISLERAVGVAATLALVFSIAVIGERVARGTGLLGAILASSVLLPFGVHAYSWTLGLATLVAGVALLGMANRDGPQRESSSSGWSRADVCTAVSGVLCGLSTVFRPDLVVAIAFVGVVVRWSSPAKGRWRRWITWSGVGAAPWIIHVALVGPSAVISGVFLDPVFRLRGGRSLPLPYDFSEPVSALERLGLANAWPSAGTALTLGFWLAVAVPVVVAAALALRRFRTSEPARAVTNAEASLYAGAAVTIAVLPQLLQRPDTAHFRFVLPLAAGLLPPAIAVSIGAVTRPARIGLSVSLAVVVGLVVGSWSVYGKPAVEFAFDPVAGVEAGDGRTFPVVDAETAAEVDALLSRVDELTSPGDRVVVWTESLGRITYSEAYLYYLLPDLIPGSHHLEPNPGLVTRDGSDFLDEVLDSDLIILSERFRGWAEPNESRKSFVPGLRVQEEMLCRVDTSGPFELMRPCVDG